MQELHLAHHSEALLEWSEENLGSPGTLFALFSYWVLLLKPNGREKGALIVKGLLGNPGTEHHPWTKFGRTGAASWRKWI